MRAVLLRVCEIQLVLAYTLCVLLALPGLGQPFGQRGVLGAMYIGQRLFFQRDYNAIFFLAGNLYSSSVKSRARTPVPSIGELAP